MKKAKQRKLTPLTSEQIETLANKICAYGDDAESHAQALLVLMDEIIRGQHGEDIAYTARRIAFARCGDEAIEAQAEYLRPATTS